MMVRFIFFLFLTVVTGVLPSQGAILISGDLPETQQEEIDSILRTYTGPCPKYFQNKENLKNDTKEKHILLDKDTDFTEIKFLNTYFKERNINAQASYVPNTLWNLYVADKYLTDENIQKEYQNIDRLCDKKSPLYQKRYFSLSQELSAKIKKEGKEDLEGFLSLSTSYLEHIEKNKIEDDDWTRSLFSELVKIKKGKTSLLHQMITEEYDAHKNNKILLVRATQGIKLKNKAPTREVIKSNIRWKMRNENKGGQDLIFEDENDFECDEKLVEEKCSQFINSKTYKDNQWLYDNEGAQKLLDFPFVCSGSAFSGIKSFQELMKKKKYAPTKDLCYADSILSGFFYDAFNRGQSACTFEYYSKDPTNMIYTLQLSKDWLFTKGNLMFHFNENSLETDGIFGAQETFHPRLRQILPASQLQKDSLLKKNILYNVISSDHYKFDYESRYKNFANYIENNIENKKVTQYLLEFCDTFSQARIFSLEGKSVNPPNSSEKAQEILKGHKELVDVFFNKVSEEKK